MEKQLELATKGQLADDRCPWGTADPGRGLMMHDLAVDFTKCFPPGSTFTTSAFDEWAQARGLLVIPSSEPGSYVWTGHVRKRHQVKEKLAKRLNHPDMETPCKIVVMGSDQWRTETVAEAVATNRVLKQLDSFAETKRTELARDCQGLDLSAMPPEVLQAYEGQFDDIEDARGYIRVALANLDRKLERRKRDIQRGTPNLPNGHIRKLIEEK